MIRSLRTAFLPLLLLSALTAACGGKSKPMATNAPSREVEQAEPATGDAESADDEADPCGGGE